MNLNDYATRKTLAQGMLDLALLTANAAQLKRVLTIGDSNRFYVLLVTLITISLCLQVACIFSNFLRAQTLTALFIMGFPQILGRPSCSHVHPRNRVWLEQGWRTSPNKYCKQCSTYDDNSERSSQYRHFNIWHCRHKVMKQRKLIVVTFVCSPFHISSTLRFLY